MTIIPLYTGGGVSLSPQNAPDRTLSDFIRLVADEGYAITNGNIITEVIDIPQDEASLWQNCEKPPTPPEPEPEATAEEALAILLGGETA